MENEYYGIIYKITNTINKKIYIGQTIQTLRKRWGQHKRANNSTIYKAIKKYGSENFTTEIIDYGQSAEDLNKLEEKYILELNSLVPNGYNIRLNNKVIYNWNKDRSSKFANIKRKNASSEYFGVYIDSKTSRWKYQIIFKGKKNSVGSFNTEKEAAIARDIEVIKEKYKGVFELNFPELKEKYLSNEIAVEKYKSKIRSKKEKIKRGAINKKIESGMVINVHPDIYFYPSSNLYSVIINKEGSIVYAKIFDNEEDAVFALGCNTKSN